MAGAIIIFCFPLFFCLTFSPLVGGSTFTRYIIILVKSRRGHGQLLVKFKIWRQ